MIIWKNTKTLDAYINNLKITDIKSEAEIALIGAKNINLNEFPKLKGIFRVGIDKSNIPFEEINNKNIKIKFPSLETCKYIYKETANFTCYLILKMLYDNVGDIYKWEKYEREYLENKKILLIGLGNIGNLVFNKINNFFTNVDFFDTKNHKDCLLKNKINNADVISLHISNISENLNFIDKEKFSWMKKGTILINTARANIVNENDLIEAIENNEIRVAFDVFWEEPYKGKLLKYYPYKFFMTPHIASTNNNFLKMAYKDLINFIKEIKNEN